MVTGIQVSFVPQEDIPNSQWDDWRVDHEKILQIKVAEHLSEPLKWRMVLHAITEYALCVKQGITTEVVDNWDEAFMKNQVAGRYDAMEEAGEHNRCPYRRPHASALLVETVFYLEWMKDHTGGKS